MPVFEIETPDGTFQVDAPNQQAALSALSIRGQQPAQATDQTSSFERLGRGITDIASGLAQTAINAGYVPPAQVSPFSKASQQNYAAQASITPEALAATTNKMMAEQEAEYQAKRGPNANRMDWMRVLGNIAGAAPLAVVPGAQGVGANVALGAGIGALSAGMQPVYEGDFWQEKGKQARVGAAFGAGGAGIAAGLGRALSPQVDDAARAMAQEGVDLTPLRYFGKTGKRLEEKLTSLPIVGDAILEAQGRSVAQFNKAAYNRVLEPLGQSADNLPVGNEGVKAVSERVSKAYDELLPNLRFGADQQFMADLTNISQMVDEGSMSNTAKAQFEKIIQDKLMPRLAPNGTMDGRTFKQFESVISKLSARLGKGDADSQLISDALGEVLTSSRAALERNSPQEFAGQLSRVNEAFKRLVRVQNAAARNMETGTFSPNQFAQAVRSTDMSARGAAVAKGDAVMQDLAQNALATMGNLYPDSGTAGRLGAAGAGYAVASNPLLAGSIALGGSLPYTSPMQKAIAAYMTANRGPRLQGLSNLLLRNAPTAGIGAGLLAGAQ